MRHTHLTFVIPKAGPREAWRAIGKRILIEEISKKTIVRLTQEIHHKNISWKDKCVRYLCEPFVCSNLHVDAGRDNWLGQK